MFDICLFLFLQPDNTVPGLSVCIGRWDTGATCAKRSEKGSIHEGGAPVAVPEAVLSLEQKKRLRSLLAEAQFCDDSAVTLHVLLIEVSQLPPALTHHLQKPSSRVVVFPVDAQMLREVVNTISQHRNLHLGGTCVRHVLVMLVDDFRFALCS